MVLVFEAYISELFSSLAKGSALCDGLTAVCMWSSVYPKEMGMTLNIGGRNEGQIKNLDTCPCVGFVEHSLTLKQSK